MYFKRTTKKKKWIQWLLMKKNKRAMLEMKKVNSK